ncbi:hypothetical protein JG688_00000826 [Phytophthora aleatoria]|uniref:Nck-associated protein 1 n=1 Tax=Phytophthora aleatoria TaxID=2496075 RepID=A0A8J5J7C3_9STRA|nr:hypothetical protein JG688_00000826 [Phytophthora aleatoria]
MNANLPAGDLERSALHTIAISIYQLMKRLHHWQQAAWESLTRFFADNSSSDSCLLTFDSHPELTRLVLATITKYVKVNLLWTSFNVIPGLLALYSFLHHVQTIGTDTLTGKDTPHAVYSPLEHTDHCVREFVLHFGTAPLLAIQHDFQLQVADKGASLAALALSCFERFEMCHDLAKLRHQGVFDLESLVSGAYALLEEHSHYLAEYYQVFLMNGDAEGIAYTIQELLNANESTSELQSLLEGFLDSERYRINTSSAPRATWVREWRQANAHLVTRTQLPLLDVLRDRMECAVSHTQYICVNAQLVEQAASFSKCWWFRDLIFEQCFEQTLISTPSPAVGLLEILSGLAAGNYVFDELVDTEEGTQQSERMLQRMERMRTSLVDQVELGLVAVVKRDVNLQRDEISALSEEKPEPVENKVTASNRRLSSFSRVHGSEVNDTNDVSLGEAVQIVLTKVLSDECSASTSILPQGKKLLEWTTESPQMSEKEFEQWSLVDRLSWLFVSLVTRKCHPSPSAAVSSPSVLAAVRKRCFVLAPGVSGELDPREYTDAKALQHLVALIGSTGVESVCSTIANLVVAQTLKLRSSIEAEHAVLAFMDMAMSNSSSADVVLATTQARALDDIATQLVQIGTAAFLLQLLHDHSLHDTSDAWEARVAPRLLRELQLDPDRRATWTRLLPVACSSGFHSSVWKRTTFLSSVEATDTNAHMMGLAMARLLPSPHRSQSVNRCAVAALKRTAADTVQPAAGRSKLQLDSRLSTRPLLEALELLVTTAASGSGEAQGSALEEMDLSLERLLPHAMLVLHSAA